MKEYRNLPNNEKQKIREEILRLHEENGLGNGKIKRYLQDNGIKISGVTIELQYNPEYKSRRNNVMKKRREEYKATAFTKEYRLMSPEEKQRIDEEILKLRNDNIGNYRIIKYFQDKGIKISHPTIRKINDSNYQDKMKNKRKSFREKYRQILSLRSDEILQIYKQNEGKGLEEMADKIRQILPNVPNGVVNDTVDGLDSIVFNGVQQKKRKIYYLGKSVSEIRKLLGLQILRERGKEDKIIEYLKQKDGSEETAVMEEELNINRTRKTIINMLSRGRIKSIRPPFACNTNNVCYFPEKENEAREKVKKIGAINFKRSVEKSIASQYRNSATIEKARSLIPTLQRYFDRESIFTTEDLKNESGMTDTTNSGKCIANSLIDILLHSKGSFFNHDQYYSFSREALEDFERFDINLKA